MERKNFDKTMPNSDSEPKPLDLDDSCFIGIDMIDHSLLADAVPGDNNRKVHTTLDPSASCVDEIYPGEAAIQVMIFQSQ